MEILSCVGVICKTSDRIFKAGRYVVAPNGDINADTDTKKMIQIFILLLKTECGGPVVCLCRSSPEV